MIKGIWLGFYFFFKWYLEDGLEEIVLGEEGSRELRG